MRHFMIIAVVLPCVMACRSMTSSQTLSDVAPEAGCTPESMFSFAQIPRFRLVMTQEAIDLLNTSERINDGNRPKVDATFTSGAQTFDVEVKLKGQLGSFTRMDEKPGLKIKFKENRFCGLKNLTLNNMRQDQTLVNQTLAYLIYREAKVPGPRTGYAQLTINDIDYGLYVNFETEDKTFLKTAFEDSSGQLYDAPSWGRDLRTSDIEAWDLEEGDEAEGRHNLKAFIDQIAAQSPDAVFFGDTALLDTPSFLSIMAVEVLTRDPDGIVGANNNFRIYFKPSVKKWFFIPAGRDRAFEKTFSALNASNLLAYRCLQSDRCIEAYDRRLKEVAQIMQQMHLANRFDQLVAFVKEAGANDPRSLSTQEETGGERTRVREDLASASATVSLNAACNVQTLHGSQYRLCPVSTTFADAKAGCESHGMQLAWFDNSSELAAVDAVAQEKFSRWWLGVSDAPEYLPEGASLLSQGFFQLVDGRTPAVAPWSPGEPNNWHGIEHCVQVGVYSQGITRWNDNSCDNKMPYICRKP